MAAIPFLFGAAGMLVNGYVTDWSRDGPRLKAVRFALLPGCSVLPPLRWSYRKRQHPCSGSADWHGTVL
ncbi:hypothetical protein ACLBR5_28920 [Escherichia coli]